MCVFAVHRREGGSVDVAHWRYSWAGGSGDGSRAVCELGKRGRLALGCLLLLRPPLSDVDERSGLGIEGSRDRVAGRATTGGRAGRAGRPLSNFNPPVRSQNLRLKRRRDRGASSDSPQKKAGYQPPKLKPPSSSAHQPPATRPASTPPALYARTESRPGSPLRERRRAGASSGTLPSRRRDPREGWLCDARGDAERYRSLEGAAFGYGVARNGPGSRCVRG
jgi:hypothetical protein